jgi:hypothetical protein
MPRPQLRMSTTTISTARVATALRRAALVASVSILAVGEMAAQLAPPPPQPPGGIPDLLVDINVMGANYLVIYTVTVRNIGKITCPSAGGPCAFGGPRASPIFIDFDTRELGVIYGVAGTISFDCYQDTVQGAYVRCFNGILNAGDVGKVYAVGLTPLRPGTYKTSVVVSSPQGDRQVANNYATATFTVPEDN